MYKIRESIIEAIEKASCYEHSERNFNQNAKAVRKVKEDKYKINVIYEKNVKTKIRK